MYVFSLSGTHNSSHFFLDLFFSLSHLLGCHGCDIANPIMLHLDTYPLFKPRVYRVAVEANISEKREEINYDMYKAAKKKRTNFSFHLLP